MRVIPYEYTFKEYTKEEIDKLNSNYNESVEIYSCADVIQIINCYTKFDEVHTIENTYITNASAEIISHIINLPSKINSEGYRSFLSQLICKFEELTKVNEDSNDDSIEEYEDTDSESSTSAIDDMDKYYNTVDVLNGQFQEHVYTGVDSVCNFCLEPKVIYQVSHMVKFSFDIKDSVFFGNIVSDIVEYLNCIISEVDEYDKILALYQKR
jgi:hypothetical protein